MRLRSGMDGAEPMNLAKRLDAILSALDKIRRKKSGASRRT
jgi:hypothetical protein